MRRRSPPASPSTRRGVTGYIAGHVRQDSNVEFTANGDATLRHPDGVSNFPADGWFERNDISGSRLPILARGTNNQHVENWVH